MSITECRAKASLMQKKFWAFIGIKEGDLFLDLGSGEGYFSIAALQAVGKPGIVYAYDRVEAAIDRLRKEMEEKTITNIVPSVVDITKCLPLGDGSMNISFYVQCASWASGQ